MQTPQHFVSLRGSPVFIFRVLLAGLMVSTGIGVAYAVLRRSAFEQAFPGTAIPTVYAALLLVGGLGLLTLAGLWYWRRWAVILYGVLTLASIILDLAAHAPVAHQITVIVGAVAVFTLVYLNRDRFRPVASAGAA